MVSSLAYAQKVSNKDGRSTGSFEIATSAASPVQAYYSVFGAAPDNIVVMITPNREFVLNAHIINAKGQKQMTIESATVSQRYVKNIDVSSLASGHYFFELLYEGGKSYRIPFSKE